MNLTIIPFSVFWNRNTVTKTSCFPEINYVSDSSATRGGTDNYSEADFPSASPPYVSFPIDFNVNRVNPRRLVGFFRFNLSLWQISPTPEAVTDRLEFDWHNTLSPPSLGSYLFIHLFICLSSRDNAQLISSTRVSYKLSWTDFDSDDWRTHTSFVEH